MNLSDLIATNSKFIKIAMKYDAINYMDIYQEAWLKIKELEQRKTINTKNPEGYFSLTCKSILIDRIRKEKLIEIISNEYNDGIEVEQNDYSVTAYQQALQNVIDRNDDTSNLIKLYLHLPNLKKISNFTELSYDNIQKIYKYARECIELEYNRIATFDDNNRYNK